MERLRYIYITTNKINGKKYIGQRLAPKELDEHSLDNDYYLGSGNLLIAAIKKYGRKNFKKQIWKVCHSQQEADIYEAELIKKTKAVESDYYYNIYKGGQYWREGHSEDVSKAMKSLFDNMSDAERLDVYLRRHVAACKNQGITPKYTNPDEYNEYHKLKAKAKADKTAAIRARVDAKIKQREHDEWFNKHSPMAVMIKANKKAQECKRNKKWAEDNWKDPDIKMRMIKGKKIGAKDRAIKEMQQNGNYIGLYLYEHGIYELRTLGIPKRLNAIKRSKNKEQAILRQAPRMYDITNKINNNIDYKTVLELLQKMYMYSD